MADQQTKTRKDAFLSRMKERHPEINADDEEMLFGSIGDDYDAYENDAKKYKDDAAKLTGVFSSNPAAAGFLTDLAKGNDPWEKMIERMGIDGITEIFNDPAKKDAFAKANKMYVERVAEESRLVEEYKKNIEETSKMLDQIQQERGLSDEVVDAAADMLCKIGHEILVGKITRESLDMALKAQGYDSAVSNARSEGEVAGRNAKIEEARRKRAGGDGMPVMGGMNSPAEQRNRKRSIFDIARGDE